MLVIKIDYMPRNAWATKVRDATETYAKSMTPDDALHLSLYFLMGVVEEHKEYISKFYGILKDRMNLSNRTVGNLLKDSENGMKGTEVTIMEALKRSTRNPAVSNTIELALTYGMEVERYTPNKN